ncbi:putative ribonuclease H-like domain-containing protein [Tanacetum coccineum]|uniref:Ribonuclease H-like domain-containing protein n=1 Tax=Tanacetum coccineum TaxID=301880 RepID=A0ABQ5A6L1_9ASTR
MTHPSTKRNMVPKAVLMRSGLVSLTTARPVNTAQPRTTVNSARPMTNVFNKAHSTVRIPINNKTTTKNSNFNKRVNIVSGMNVNSARPKVVVNAAKPKIVLNAVKGNQCINHSEKGNPQMDLQDQGVIDSGCSRHMTRNMSYLTNFEEIDGGYVAFGGNPKGGEITDRGGLTCLFAKATCDESKLWHRGLGHINFKTMNKLVKGNLVRGLPSKLFESDQTCVACQKGKATRAFSLGFMRPFGCPVTILNTIDHLGKFDGKADEGFFVGYSINSKAFRIFNNRTMIVEENLHVQTNQSNSNAGIKACDDAGKARKETVPGKDYILLPLWHNDPLLSQNSKSSPDDGFKPSGDNEKKVTEEPGKEGGDPSNKNDSVNSTNNINNASDGNNTNNVNTVSSTVNTAGIEVNVVSNDYKDVGTEADMNNVNTFMPVSPIPTTRIHKDLPVEQIIGDLNSAPQTRRMTKNLKEHRYTQEEGIDYDEVFALVARIEAIMLFLAYASFKDSVMYQMDVKSAFLYGKVEEEVYVCQPPGFEDPDFLNRVYKVEKALYGLHQAPRAWYETLSTYIGWVRKTTNQVAYTNSYYAGASLNKKSTTGGYQFLRCRLISWQCKKQTVVANSTTEAEYVDASSCCGQMLWIQN